MKSTVSNTVSPKRHALSKGNFILLTAIIFVFLGGAAMMVLSNSKVTQGLVLATTRQPEPFTELYFAQPTALPKQVVPGRTSRLRFIVKNHENKSLTYRARVTLIENGRSRVILNSSYLLNNNQSISVPVAFTNPAAGTNFELVIELPDQSQTIHFKGASS